MKPIPYAFPDFGGIDFDALSPKRQQALQIIKDVVPSTEGERKFDQLMTHQRCVEARDANPKFTTCGALPAWYFKRLGVNIELASYGLASVRDTAIKLGCWCSNDALHSMLYRETYHAERRPLPGDVYLLAMSRNDGEIAHIGVVINPSGNQWWRADAGQGSHDTQQALYVKRQWQPHSRQLDGENYGRGTGRPPRRLIGWVDLDRAAEC